MFSSKSQNASKILIYLAENPTKRVPLKEIAEEKGLSLKYLEQIIPALLDNRYLDAKQGKAGGYVLRKDPKDINVWEILLLYEKDIYPIEEINANPNELGKTREMFINFYELEKDYFLKISIADLTKAEYVLDYVI